MIHSFETKFFLIKKVFAELHQKVFNCLLSIDITDLYIFLFKNVFMVFISDAKFNKLIKSNLRRTKGHFKF